MGGEGVATGCIWSWKRVVWVMCSQSHSSFIHLFIYWGHGMKKVDDPSFKTYSVAS